MEDFRIFLGVITGTFTSLIAFAVDWVQAAIDTGLSPSPAAMLGYFLMIAFFLGSAFVAATFAEIKGRSRALHFVGGLILPYVYPALVLFVLPTKLEQKRSPADGEGQAPHEGGEDSDQIRNSAISDPNMSPVDQTKKLQVKRPKKDAESTQELQATLSVENARPAPPKGGQTTVWRQSVKDAAGVEQPAHMDSAATLKIPIGTKTQTDILTATLAMKSSAEARAASELLAQAADTSLFTPQYFSSISIDPSGKPQGPFMFEMFDGRILEATRIVSPMPDVLVLEIPGGGANPRTIRVPYSKIKTCKLKSEWLGQ